ncbi:hypothetical protein ACGFWD_26780 [Streptomyces sp. NPDC048448]|uniref:hypothetical protein n=1 Tax=Streptomyces sp. NPDC048448 TaxID=3365554 RepID=UPI003716AE7E
MTDYLPAPRQTSPGPDLEPAAEIAQLTEELSRLSSEAQRLTAGAEPATEPGTGLVQASGQQAVEAKASMVRQLARLQRLQDDVDRRTKRLRDLMQAQLHAAHRALQPLKAQAARMQEGIDAITLYLGIDEGIEMLRDGEPAGADTPVVLRQMVLSADQECMVAAEDGGLDVEGLDDFFAWLLADGRHLDQVLPEPKGVVALVPSRTERRYGADPWFNAAMKKANAATFFLVRNGERLYVVFNELTLQGRLFPAADEFASLFRDHQGRPLGPGSHQWKKAEEAADATRRQYMKVGLLLQGLADRTTVLHPHPGQGLNLLDQDAIDDGRVVLVPDAEDAYALSDGSERFTDWHKRVNAQLRPGMRVIVASRSTAFRDLAYGREDYRRGHSRLHPPTADAPSPDMVHTIEERRADGGLVIRYARADEVWTDRGPRPARVRASCTVRADDSFVLAYDAADPDLLRAFLRNRVDRAHYLDMVPVINAALAAKVQERAAEAPFRQMAVGMLMQDAGVRVDEAEDAVVGLVDWWKFASRVHRPLTGRGAEADAKAAREILAEFHRRRRTDHGRVPEEVVEAVAARQSEALLIAQTHAGHLVVLTAEGDGPYVTEHSYTRRGVPRYSREWVLPGARPNRWTTLRSTPRWENWDRGATLAEHLSGPEREALAEQAARLARAEFPGRRVAAVTLQGTHAVIAWTVGSWGRADEERPATGTLEPVTVEGYGFDWRRDRRQQPVAGASRPFGQRAWDQKGGRRPWEASWGQVARVLSVDSDLVERADAAHARHQAVARRRDAIREAARTAYRTAETVWDERQETKAYDAFLAEYGEPSLWEGHRKTIKLAPMPEPPGQTPGSSRLLGTTWFTALTTLIESGANLSDYTLGQALEAQELTGIPAELHALPLHRPQGT